MKKNIVVIALLVAVLLGTAYGQAKYEDFCIAKVPVRTVQAQTEQTAAYYLYEDSGCRQVDGFTEDRFEYEVANLNPGVDINDLHPGQYIRVPWNR